MSELGQGPLPRPSAAPGLGVAKVESDQFSIFFTNFNIS